MALSKDEILDAIAEMSVMDIVALIEAMEEKFGVTAAAAVAAAPAAAGGGDAAGAAEEQTEFDVVLTAAGEKKAAGAAAKIDPAAKKIYDAGTEAIRKLKGISFTSTLKLEMKDPADEAMLPPGFGGKVRYSVRFAEGGKSGLGFDTIRADMLDGDNAGNYAVLAPEASISARVRP